MEKTRWGDLLGFFFGCMRVRTEHGKKTNVCLWGELHSLIAFKISKNNIARHRGCKGKSKI